MTRWYQMHGFIAVLILAPMCFTQDTIDTCRSGVPEFDATSGSGCKVLHAQWQESGTKGRRPLLCRSALNPQTLKQYRGGGGSMPVHFQFLNPEVEAATPILVCSEF